MTRDIAYALDSVIIASLIHISLLIFITHLLQPITTEVSLSIYLDSEAFTSESKERLQRYVRCRY